MASVGPVQFGKVASGAGSVGANSTGPVVGIEGGGIVSGPTLAGKDFYQDGMDASWGEGIPGFLNEVFAPALDRAKQGRMWQGFVRAREGATMEEINADRPWFSELFGPTDYALGATLYTTQKTMADFEADFANRMPELRELSAEDMGREFNKVAESLRTGDEFTDAVIHKNMMERSSTLMDLHTKQRTAWLQAEQVRMQVEGVGSQATSYNSMAKQYALLGKTRPLEAEEADRQQVLKLRLLESMQTSKFQTDGSIEAVYESSIRGMADRGEFYSLRTIEESGVFDAMRPELALSLRGYIQQKEDSYRGEFLDSRPDFAAKLALVSVHAAQGTGGLPTAAMIDEIEREYAAETGSSVPLYSGSSRASIMAQSTGNHIQAQEEILRAREAAAKAANTEAAKLAADEEDIRGGVTAWRSGTYANAINVPGVDKEMIEASVVQTWNQSFAKSPQTALSQLVWNANTGRGAVLKGVAEQYQTRARAVLREQPNDAAKALFEEWLMLKNSTAQRLDVNGNPVDGKLTGATTAALYFGDSVNTMFNELQALTESNVDFQLAYEVVRGKITTADPTAFDATSRKESQQLQSRLADTLQRSNPKYFGFFGNRLGKSGREAAARAMVRAVGESGGLLDTSQEGMTAALQHARLKFGGEDAGKYYWENGRDDEGHAIKGVGTWLGFLDTKETGPAIEAAIDSQLLAHGITPSPDLKVDIFRMRDGRDGEPQLVVNTVGDRGWKVVSVSGEQIRAEYNKRAAKQRRTQAPVPPGYVRAADGSLQPSISIQPKM